MKILTGSQIKQADRCTIEREPVESIALMERAAEVIAQAICNKIEQGSDLLFFVGKGNNGGDGLAVARMLSNVGFRCSVLMLYPMEELSEECRINFERLPEQVVVVGEGALEVTEDIVVIDAVLGSGVIGEVREPVSSSISLINSLGCQVISIDLPSGMKTEFDNNPDKIVHADVTLTLEFPKLAMLLPEAGECSGEIEVLSIELDQMYMIESESEFDYIDKDLVYDFMQTRRKFSHKGDYGHALLVCGSRNMCGAAILATSAALRSGCGLVTVHVPEKCANAMFASVPSAMLSLDKSDVLSELPSDLDQFTTIGVGCGLGTFELTISALKSLFKLYHKPMVIDADALNIIAMHPEMLDSVPADSILTPHVGEFKRLAGEWKDEREKLDLLRKLSARTKSTIIIKGYNTVVCTANGMLYFNSTGGPGMAKGGSGDILTGFISGLIARGYEPSEAAIMGVYLHGLAGEKAADYYGVEGMNSGDITDFLAEALNEVR